MDEEKPRRVTYEPCGCVSNNAGAHQPECAEFRTVKDRNGRALYWVRNEEVVGA